MSSVEPSKVPAVGAARAVAAGERAQIEARPRPAAAASGSAAASGVSLEVSAPVEAAAPPAPGATALAGDRPRNPVPVRAGEVSPMQLVRAIDGRPPDGQRCD